MNQDAGRYHSPLRDRQKRETRDLILKAVGTILQRASLADVTIAEVARTADVTERTIYRHFPTREHLLRAFWIATLERLGGVYDAPQTLDGYLDLTRRWFTNFDTEEGILRGIAASPEGRAIRQPPNKVRLDTIERIVAPLTEGLPRRERHHIASTILTLCSISGWMHMRDYCGYDGREAGEATAYAIGLLVEAGRRRAAAARRK
jgi:AcrR family transcriptional regulator